tara:strand:+ start:1617 stop:4817 length:3201 start_codon:yes stop_codon:yes gene_type:complete
MASYTRQSSFADGDTITAALFNNEFNQLVNAFHNSTGHKHDGTTAEGPVIGLIGDAGETSPNNKVLIDTTNNHIEFYVEVSSSPVQQIRIQDGAVIPITDSDVDLGTSSLYFKDAYIDSITTTGNVAVGGNLTVTGTTTFNGGTITMGDAATDNVVFGADVDSNIIPDDDNTYDLGSSSQQWKDIYIDGVAYLDAIDFNGTTITSTAAELNILDGVTSTAAELNILDGVTSTATELNLLDGVTATTTELNYVDVSTAGTVEASKAIVTDSNKDITGGRNITISGELDAATLDISGDVDIDGTLEADAITVNGTTLAETISDTVGAMVSSNTETNITVTYDDSDNTLDFVLPASLEITTSIGVGGGSTNGVVIQQGGIKIKNGGTQSYVDFYCESNNAHYLRLQAPAHASFSGNPTVTLPSTAGTIALTTGNVATATALATARTIHGVSFDGTANIDLTEVVQDTVGAMFSSNTESGITVTYEDSDGTIDLTVGTLNQSTTGNAATATALETARTIHGVSFDGTANIDLSEVVQDTVGAMFSSNTETGIAATYEDGDGTIDLVIGSDVIVNSMIADDAIDSAQIADGAIDTVHIADDQVTGDKLANDITIANNLSVAGNLTVTGTTTQTGSVVSDSNFTGLTDENTGNTTDFGFYGKYVESSTTKYAGLYYDASTDNTFRLFCDTQTVPSTTVNTSATGYAAGNLIVNNLTGTIATAAQTNITSVGTLSSLTISGDLAVDTSTLKVDSSNNRVGIGNASPDVSLDLGSNTDSIHIPVGTTAQRPGSPAAGYFRYNSTTGEFEGYTDAWGSIGGGSGSFSTNIFTGDDSTTAFTLSSAPSSENNLMVFIDGVFQAHNSYSVSGTTLTLSEAPLNGRVITAYNAEEVAIGTPSDNSVSTAKIAADAVTGAKIADDAIDSEHYTDGSIDTAHIGDDQVTGAKIENAVTFATSATAPAVTATAAANVTQQALTSSSNAVAWDAAAKSNAFHLTTENTTISAPTNNTEGAIISIEIAQGGTPRTVAWNTAFEFAASTAPTITATANKTDIFSFRYNGSVWQEVGRVQNLAQT